eukprot:7379581-Prymnesium_polylepis.1
MATAAAVGRSHGLAGARASRERARRRRMRSTRSPTTAGVQLCAQANDEFRLGDAHDASRMAKGYVRSSNLERHPAIRAGCRLRRPIIGRPHL